MFRELKPSQLSCRDKASRAFQWSALSRTVWMPSVLMELMELAGGQQHQPLHCYWPTLVATLLKLTPLGDFRWSGNPVSHDPPFPSQTSQRYASACNGAHMAQHATHPPSETVAHLLLISASRWSRQAHTEPTHPAYHPMTAATNYILSELSFCYLDIPRAVVRCAAAGQPLRQISPLLILSFVLILSSVSSHSLLSDLYFWQSSLGD